MEKNKVINKLAKSIIVCAFNTLKDGLGRVCYLDFDEDVIKVHSYLNYKHDLKIDITLRSKRDITEVLGKTIKELLEEQ